MHPKAHTPIAARRIGLDEMGVQGRGARTRIDLDLDGWQAEQR